MPQLRKVNLEQCGPMNKYKQRKTSHHDEIKKGQPYLIRTGGHYRLGYSSMAHYGWSFHVGAFSMQLDHIETLWEIVG